MEKFLSCVDFRTLDMLILHDQTETFVNSRTPVFLDQPAFKQNAEVKEEHHKCHKRHGTSDPRMIEVALFYEMCLCMSLEKTSERLC